MSRKYALVARVTVQLTDGDDSEENLDRQKSGKKMHSMLKALWQYRGFIVSSIRNEFAARFIRSRLGGLWMIINPLAQVAIYALILSNVLAAKLPGIDNKYAYALYLMAGTLGWNLFLEITTRCLSLFIDQGNLMKKIQFPRITLPVIVVGSALLNNVLLFLSMLLCFALLGHGLSAEVLWLVPLTVAVIAFAAGLGLVLGVLNVFVRDVGQVIPIILQIWFWFTPIVYPATIVPEEYRSLMILNPMNPVVTAYQSVIVYGAAPDFSHMGSIFFVAALLLLLGLFLFRRSAPEMVDAL